ncbi:hypothetical protein ADK70_25870 [Streptomyces rimosus subsp. pseudoverticillatus]|uniref:hypothetical protein n=1 Tax=Streptomyces rimosus TaxID=1927 RepID=UPI0006B29868|nr:hypothetical protein ADK70_25870 [Streptomyces rimosus subsp. pseudoverticillatus]
MISVDYHVIEPAHLFETWLPAKYRGLGPKPFTAGIGELAYVGAKYKFTTDPVGPLHLLLPAGLRRLLPR